MNLSIAVCSNRFFFLFFFFFSSSVASAGGCEGRGIGDESDGDDEEVGGRFAPRSLEEPLCNPAPSELDAALWASAAAASEPLKFEPPICSTYFINFLIFSSLCTRRKIQYAAAA